MIVTLFSDASWCPDTLAGGWGAWGRSSRVERGVQWAGELRLRPRSSNEAELMAAANALYCAIRDGVTLGDDVILFQIDNQHALNVIRHGWRDGLTEYEQRVMRRMLEWRQAYRLQFRIKHVHGHSYGSARESVNSLCDRLARGHMEQLRGRLRQNVASMVGAA